MLELLPVYKRYNGVPLYLYPNNLEEIRRYIVEKYGSVKKARPIIRREFRCFLSENAIWKKIVRVPVDKYEEPPVDPKLSLAVIMARGTKKNFDYFGYLASKGLPINPYSYASRGECVGFYVKEDFSKIDDILSDLAKNKLIRDAIIVNGVWYLRLGKPVNLRKLISTGVFVPSTTHSFKLVTGIIDTVKVSVFHTGTVRLAKALTPEQSKEVSGKVYGLLKAYGAIGAMQ